MRNLAIEAHNLGKYYRIGKSKSDPSVKSKWRGQLAAAFTYLQTTIREPRPEEIFWALKDVSFEVKSGEVFGVIGPNGAGKSTLLKVLSRITEPTQGRAQVYGRLGAMLEVGTGFHPELTGRENIYLNGVILGMRRTEIDKKFEEIVEFAEIERFLDTPVKRYSSGMYVRLAFAVAAHLEPEILLIDEVLAVGDATFQKKCLGKLGEVAKEGRTILFVSHNMTALQSLCQRALWVDKGQVKEIGKAGTVVSHYLQTCSDSVLEQRWEEPATAPGNDKVRLHRVRIIPKMPSSQGDTLQITVNTPIRLECEYWNFIPKAHLNFSLVLYSLGRVCVFNSIAESVSLPAGLISGCCQIPAGLLNSETYSIRLLIVQDQSVVLLDYEDAIIFDVHEVERDGPWYGKWIGVVRPQLKWTTTFVQEFE